MPSFSNPFVITVFPVPLQSSFKMSNPFSLDGKLDKFKLFMSIWFKIFSLFSDWGTTSLDGSTSGSLFLDILKTNSWSSLEVGFCVFLILLLGCLRLVSSLSHCSPPPKFNPPLLGLVFLGSGDNNPAIQRVNDK